MDSAKEKFDKNMAEELNELIAKFEN